VRVTTFEEHQAATAARLGYRTVAEMNSEHDPLHEALCRAIGFIDSPTLWRVRWGLDLDLDWVRYEESMVLAGQQFRNSYRAWAGS
jgi:hypothetical protein